MGEFSQPLSCLHTENVFYCLGTRQKLAGGRGGGVETEGGSQIFETAEKGGVMKNGPLKVLHMELASSENHHKPHNIKPQKSKVMLHMELASSENHHKPHNINPRFNDYSI